MAPAADMDWLRGKAFGSLEDTEGSTGKKWLITAASIAILLGGLVYLWHMYQPYTGGVTPPSAAVAPGPASLPPPSAEPREAVVAPTPPVEQPPLTLDDTTVESTPRVPAPASNAPSGRRSAQVPQEKPHGEEELRLAERYLDGEAGRRDSVEAAKWLWRAVAKQNAHATVLLADLYARGDGVGRSCSQARLLLLAAAKKHTPDAAQKLRNLESQGCP